MNADTQPSVYECNSSLNATETVIAGLWKEVLEVSGAIGGAENFFQLGGDSISMVTVLFRVQEELSVELPPESMFAAPTLRELAALVDAASNGSPASIT